MKLHSKTQHWTFGASPQFCYTQIIIEDGNDYFWTRSDQRNVDFQHIQKNDLKAIPKEHISPLYDTRLTKYDLPESPNVYIKRPRLSGYDGSAIISSRVLQEAYVCELLMQNPHPNIARYLGCISQDGRITGLCFEMYAETLAERIDDGRFVNDGSALQQIQAGIEHLHSLCLVHSDIQKDNIMFRDAQDEKLVIIDYDSCVFQGDPLPDKRIPLPEDINTAEFANDEFGLNNILELHNNSV